jgi:hypothetical protein
VSWAHLRNVVEQSLGRNRRLRCVGGGLIGGQLRQFGGSLRHIGIADVPDLHLQCGGWFEALFCSLVSVCSAEP